MKPLRFGAHGAGRLDGDHFQPTRGKPSRIATGPRADIQNQRRCVWKQVDQPAVDGSRPLQTHSDAIHRKHFGRTSEWASSARL